MPIWSYSTKATFVIFADFLADSIEESPKENKCNTAWLHPLPSVVASALDPIGPGTFVLWNNNPPFKKTPCVAYSLVGFVFAFGAMYAR